MAFSNSDMAGGTLGGTISDMAFSKSDMACGL